MDQMEVVVDGERVMRRIDHIDVTRRWPESVVPECSEHEEAFYCLDGTCYVVKRPY